MTQLVPIVFVCSPCRGNETCPDMVQNLEEAEALSHMVVEAGGVPVTPHFFYQGILSDADVSQRQIGLSISRRMVTICSRMVVHPIHTEGMRSEISLAQMMGIETLFLPYVSKEAWLYSIKEFLKK